MSYVTPLKPQQVNTPELLGRYCQEQTGIPYPTMAQLGNLRKAIKSFFATYPDATYSSLTNLVQWSKVKNRRYAHVANLVSGGLRYAYMDGYIPEIDPNRKKGNINELIDDALFKETDPSKRMVLMGATTDNAKRYVYENWMKEKELV